MQKSNAFLVGKVFLLFRITVLGSPWKEKEDIVFVCNT